MHVLEDWAQFSPVAHINCIRLVKLNEGCFGGSLLHILEGRCIFTSFLKLAGVMIISIKSNDL